jgi:hypothetical protein
VKVSQEITPAIRPEREANETSVAEFHVARRVRVFAGASEPQGPSPAQLACAVGVCASPVRIGLSVAGNGRGEGSLFRQVL